MSDRAPSPIEIIMSKKDKSKGIQRSDDSKIIRHLGIFQDIQVPIQNKFSSLTNYPPFPYKTVVTRTSTKPHDLYHLKHTEHLFFTNLKSPSRPTLKPLIQRTLKIFITSMTILRKPKNFTNSF